MYMRCAVCTVVLYELMFELNLKNLNMQTFDTYLIKHIFENNRDNIYLQRFN